MNVARSSSRWPTSYPLGRGCLGGPIADSPIGASDNSTPSLVFQVREERAERLPQFRAACGYVASQGWLIAQNDVVTLTTAGLAAAQLIRLTNRMSTAKRSPKAVVAGLPIS